MGNCIRRSNAMLNYGTPLVYRESLVYPNVLAGVVAMSTLLVFGTSFALPPLKWLLASLCLPKPGDSPATTICCHYQYLLYYHDHQKSYIQLPNPLYPFTLVFICYILVAISNTHIQLLDTHLILILVPLRLCFVLPKDKGPLKLTWIGDS